MKEGGIGSIKDQHCIYIGDKWVKVVRVNNITHTAGLLRVFACTAIQ